jgi:hypothetical protein
LLARDHLGRLPDGQGGFDAVAGDDAVVHVLNGMLSGARLLG